MEYRFKRIVVGQNEEGKSAVLTTTCSNVQEEPNFFYRATLWSEPKIPADNSAKPDFEHASIAREPPFGGAHVRVLELHPENPDKDDVLRKFKELNKNVAQKYEPSAEDSARHPMMHKTDTVDIIFVVKGEIYLITDVEEMLCTPGDCLVIRGTNHGWSVRGTEPCFLMGVMLSAKPLE